MPFKFSSFFKASDLHVKLAILYVKTPDTQHQSGTKKEPIKKALNLNGGNDEARTRDLMRDSCKRGFWNIF